MKTATTVPELIKGVQGELTKLRGEWDAEKKRRQERRKARKGKPNYKGRRPGEVFNKGIRARNGENIMSSRGYSFTKLIGYIVGKNSPGNGIPANECKIELDMHNRLQESYKNRMGFTKAEANSILAPVGSELINEDLQDESLAAECREITKAGVVGADLREVQHYRKKYWGRNKALSWVDETLGGALVAPPMQGELIEILRNNEALLAAGARVLGMPPMGRITYPRQTGVATAYWVGENLPITDSNEGTGDLTLQAKKLGVLVKIPNELFRFASVSIEQFVRDDIARVMGLLLDKYLLEGGTVDAPTSGNAPKGLITYPNINKLVAGVTGANGDTFQPEDIAKMVAAVEEVNAIFKAFIMRPLMYAALTNRRADAAVAGDQKGPFLFNITRDIQGQQFNFGRGMPSKLDSYDVVKSTQVSKRHSKGTANNLSYTIGGDFNDFIVAMGGVIEFLVATQGDTAVASDQTWVRGIQYVDGGPRHEASFVLMDNLLMA